jgi:hypothetical protein
MIPETDETLKQLDEPHVDRPSDLIPRNQVTFEPITEIEQQKLADLDWAASSPEVQEHSGRFVVIHKKRVVAVGDDRASLVAEAAKQEQCPWWHLVVEVVPNWDELKCVPSEEKSNAKP